MKIGGTMFDLETVRKEHHSFILKLQSEKSPVYDVYCAYAVMGCRGFLGHFSYENHARNAWTQLRIGTNDLPIYQIGEKVE